VTVRTAAVLRPGDRVRYDGADHVVVALAGTSVRLRSEDGSELVVLAGHLMACPEFEVAGGGRLPEVEPSGLLEGLPARVLEKAREWERHVVEAQAGLPPGAPAGAVPRPGFDPAVTTVCERDRAKAAELGVSPRAVQERRLRYARQGLWGLVDQRAAQGSTATGRADARLVAVVRNLVDSETDASTGTRSRLIRRAVKAVEAAYGPGVVPLPGRTTFYKVIDAVVVGRHTFGSAVTRRQAANRPQGVFTPSFAARPGEQVQIDSTPIDVLVWLEDGVPARADLTIAVDVATRTICAAVLRPAGTKAVDAALLLARMLVPEPMRPGWAAALAMSASWLPHARLLGIDARMELAAARPVIVPDTIVIDGGKVFVSETFTRACERLGISVQRARPHTGTDKPIVEATFGSVNTLFCQHVAAYTAAPRSLSRQAWNPPGSARHGSSPPPTPKQSTSPASSAHPDGAASPQATPGSGSSSSARSADGSAIPATSHPTTATRSRTGSNTTAGTRPAGPTPPTRRPATTARPARPPSASRAVARHSS